MYIKKNDLKVLIYEFIKKEILFLKFLYQIYIFDSDLVMRMQLMIRYLRLKGLLIEFVIPDLGRIYFCIPEFFKKKHLKPVFEYKLYSEIVF